MSTPSFARIPGYLFATIPALLGFYPQDSVVLMGLEPHGSGQPAPFILGRLPEHGTYALGQVLRADASAPSGVLAQGRSLLAEAGSGAFVAFVVGTPPPERLRAVLRDWARGEGSPPFCWGCWHAPGIATGERYAAVRGVPVPEPWRAGTIESVAASPTMGCLLKCGELPEINRREARAFFDPQGAPWPVDARDCLALVSEIRRRSEALAEVMAEAGALLEGEGEARHLAILLGHHRVRDALIPQVLDHAEGAHRTMLAVARKTKGEVRANALCLYALAAAQSGRRWRVPFALQAAQEEVPGHNLARLLHAMAVRCGIEAMLDAVREGAQGADPVHY
ncbi:DUF4192 domain-containing protein [Corynebacterium mastitidis]|nr:DUF4192 domain-containing protein [Corynebacterium mastitidis]MCH6195945.1 DUF4192 domain-containing protein [Corynebacterium mastitidis]